MGMHVKRIFNYITSRGIQFSKQNIIFSRKNRFFLSVYYFILPDFKFTTYKGSDKTHAILVRRHFIKLVTTSLPKRKMFLEIFKSAMNTINGFSVRTRVGDLHLSDLGPAEWNQR